MNIQQLNFLLTYCLLHLNISVKNARTFHVVNQIIIKFWKLIFCSIRLLVIFECYPVYYADKIYLKTLKESYILSRRLRQSGLFITDFLLSSVGLLRKTHRKLTIVKKWHYYPLNSSDVSQEGLSLPFKFIRSIEKDSSNYSLIWRLF